MKSLRSNKTSLQTRISGSSVFSSENRARGGGLSAGSLEIAQGEVTGHAHVLHAGAIGFDTDREKRVSRLDLPQGGALRHDEHAPIDLPPGSYEVRRQREYAYGEPVSADD